MIEEIKNNLVEIFFLVVVIFALLRLFYII